MNLLLIILVIASVVLAFITTSLVRANLRVFRRLPEPPGPAGAPPAISVLIPARDEEAAIRASVAAALSSRNVQIEVLVLDDRSEDSTAEVVQAMARLDDRVRLIRGPELPPGWCGKQHACWVLSQEARHPLLVFLDADVRLAPDALDRMFDVPGGIRRRPRQRVPPAGDRRPAGKNGDSADAFRPAGIPADRADEADPRPRVRGGLRPALHHESSSLWTLGRAFLDPRDPPRRPETAARLSPGGAADRPLRRDRPGRLPDVPHLGRGLERTGQERRRGPRSPPADRSDVGDPVPWPGGPGTRRGRGSGVFPAAVESGRRLVGLRGPAGVVLVAVDPGDPIPPVPAGAWLHPLGILVLLAIQWYALARNLAGRPSAWKGRLYRSPQAFDPSRGESSAA